MIIWPHKAGRFVRFLAAGGMAAACNWATRFLFSLWLPFEAAVVLAFAIGLLVGFVLMRRYVFTTGQTALAAQILAYVAVNALALGVTVVVSSVMLRLVLPALEVTTFAEGIAHGCGVVAPIVTSYFGHRSVTFR